jgi:hypothetical protein
MARPASLLNPSFNCEDTFHAKRRAFVTDGSDEHVLSRRDIKGEALG